MPEKLSEPLPERADPPGPLAQLGAREYLKRVSVSAMRETAGFFRKATTESLAGGVIVGAFQLFFIGYYTWVTKGWSSAWSMLKAVGFAFIPIAILAVTLFIWSALKQSYLLVNEARGVAREAIESRERESLAEHESFVKQVAAKDDDINRLETERDNEREELRQRIAVLERPAEPDVILNFHKDAGFTLANPRDSGQARNVHIDPVTVAEYPTSATVTFNGETNPIMAPAVTARFVPVAYLGGDSEIAVTPIMGNTGPMPFATSFDDFLKAAVAKRGHEDKIAIDANLAASHLAGLERTELELSSIKATRRPLDTPFRVTYWDRSETRQWERRATLRFEVETKQAYVLLGERQEITKLLAERLTALERDAPRHLTDAARRIISDRLGPAVEKWVTGGGQAAIHVRAMPGNDCASFTLEFEDLLESIGFDIIHARIDMTVANAHDDYRRGIYIIQDKESDAQRERPSFGDALHEALLEANIPATKLDRPGPGCSLCLIVGARI